jgi:single-strand DNA-binding protein
MASRSWNRVELIGNLTRDPELRFTPNGAAVCTFGIATNRVYVTEGEKKEDVDFHRIVAWNKLAELCNQLLKKGSRTFISGRLQYREWETQDGQKRRDAEIVLEDMILLTSRNGDYSNGGGETAEDIFGGDLTSEPVAEEKNAPKEALKEEAPAEPAEKEEKEKEEPKNKPNEDVTNLDEDLPF